MPTAQARFFVRERTGDGSFVHPMYREYAEGVVSDPVPLVPDLPVDAGVWIGGIEPTGAHFAYCVSGEGMDEACFVRELAAFPDGEPQALGIDPVPAQAVFTTPEWIAEWGAYYFTAYATMSTEVGVYRAAVTDGVLTTPETLVASIGDAAPGNPTISDDRAWISFTARADVDSPIEVFVIPADGADPTAWIEVSDVLEPGMNADVAAHLHGSQALVYLVDDTSGPPDGSASFHLVDVGDLPLVGSPVRVDAPDVDGLRVRRVEVAPDDHALVYWVGAGDATFGELMLVELDGLVPQLPIRISTAGQDEVFRIDYAWSPDARWVVYVAAPDVESDWNVYFVDLAAAMPAEPVAASEPAAGRPTLVGFDAESRWFYFIADVGEGFSLYRVDVSGAEPSAPQLVAAPPAPADSLTGQVTWSNSRAELMYTVYVDALEMRQLWIVDVSGDVPGTATRVDTLRGGDGVQFGADFSPDDALIVFSEQSLEFDGPEPLRLIDRSAPDEAVLLSDDAYNVVFLPD